MTESEDRENNGFKPRRRSDRIAVRLSAHTSELVREVEKMMETSASSAAEGLIARGYKVWLAELGEPALAK